MPPRASPRGRPRSRAARPAAADRELIAAAAEVLRRSYRRTRHTVGAAVRTASGAVFTGVNLEGIHTPCAEPVAVGAAVSAGEGALAAMVAVSRRGSRYALLPPCGTCRQLLWDYGPRAYVLVPDDAGRPVRLTAAAALPYPFRTFGRRT